MSDLKRYGLEWKSDQDFVCHPMDDGYWTPWHIANEQITTLRQQLEQAQARVAELEFVLQGYQRDNKELQRLLNKQADKHIQRLRQQANEQEQPQ